jgi:hypothetical protein
VRRAARRDANHARIRDGLRDAGFEVRDAGGLGDGMSDLIVKHRGTGRVRFIEIKDPDQPPSKRALTDAEREVQALLGDLYVVVETLQEAVRAMTG